MKCYLVTYINEDIHDVTEVDIDNYDGDPYGDTVPFTVASNQTIVPEEEATNVVRCAADEAVCLDTRLQDAGATTAAMAALDAAIEVLGENPYTGGCKAFYTPQAFKELGWQKMEMLYKGVQCVIVCDGGDFAPMLNIAYEDYGSINRFEDALDNRGYRIRRLTHFAYGLLKKGEHDECM
jgi:hypothetical protein